MPGFTHLHTVSGFSVRYGASHPERLAERAAEREMDALALTDRDTLAGTVRFAKACAEAGVRPLFGAELAVAPPASGPERSETSVRRDRRRTPVRGGAFVDESAQRVTFLARDGARGWAGLCRLVSAAHTHPATPLLAWPDNHADGLTVLLGPASDVGRALAAGRPDRAARLLGPWREVYGDALRLEAVWHGRTGTGPGSLRLAARTVGFAAEQGLRPVLTNAVRYADPGQGPVADVLDAARRLVPVGAAGEPDSGEAWLKEAGAMRHAAERIVEAAGFRRDAAHRLLEQTQATAAECLVDPEDDLGIGTVHFPEPHLVGAGRRTAQRALASRAAAGMVLRGYDRRREYWERMHHELDIIAHHGFASYFLTVAQVVDDVRRMGVRVAARGSGAGSLVNHLLGIAHADPVEHGLLMERFLSKERVVLPDIDIDVESARRLEVYRAIIDRFGAERVATVAMPETYRVRHAVRDVGAALSMDPAEIDRIAKSFPHIRARDARAALEELPELRELAARKEEYGRLWELVEALDALPRGVAMHPCGVLLSDASLLSRTPVVPTSGEGCRWRSSTRTTWRISDCSSWTCWACGCSRRWRTRSPRWSGRRGEDRPGRGAGRRPGDVRADPLHRDAGLLPDRVAGPAGPGGPAPAVHLPRPRRGHLPLPARSGRRRHGAAVHRGAARAGAGALPAPGPGGAAAGHLRGRRLPRADHRHRRHHDRLRAGEADRVRRGLSDPESQGRIKVWFAQHATANGYDAETIQRTWEIVEAFGSYGFCKAHAVAFAVPTYQSAWLKAHHPAAFYAGLLTHDPGMYPKRLLLADARRRGVPILPLDVNRSGVAHRIELVSESRRVKTWGLRLALSDVHGISEAEAERIAAGQPYASLLDFWERARPSRPLAQRLAQVGALDAFGANRRDLQLHLTELHRGARAGRGDQLPLAGGRRTAPAGLPDLTSAEKLSAELGVLSMDASRNLMDDHRRFLDELGVVSARRLRSVRHGETVLVAGAKAATQTPPIRSGRRVIFSTLDDGTGLVDLAFFDDSHDTCAHTVFHSWLLLVRGWCSAAARAASAWSAPPPGTSPTCWRCAGRRGWRASRPGWPARTAAARGGPATGRTRPAAGSPARTGGRPPRVPRPRTRWRAADDPHAHGVRDAPLGRSAPRGEGPAVGRKLWHQSPGSAG